MKGVVTLKMNRNITIKKSNTRVTLSKEIFYWKWCCIYWYVNALICMSIGYLTTESIVFKCRYNGTTTPVTASMSWSCQTEWNLFCTTLLSEFFSWLLDIPMGLVPFTIQLISKPDLTNSNKEDLTSTNI